MTKKIIIGCLLLSLLGAMLVTVLYQFITELGTPPPHIRARALGIYIQGYYGNFERWPESLEELGRALTPDLRRWLNDVIVSEGITMKVYSEPTDKVFRALLEFRGRRRKVELELDCADMEECRKRALWVISKELLNEELRKEKEREEASREPL